MIIIYEFLEVILDILSLVSPEKMADKINEINTSNSTRRIWTILFTLLYGIVILGLSFTLTLPLYISYKVVGVILIIFLLYSLFKFYSLIFKH